MFLKEAIQGISRDTLKISSLSSPSPFASQAVHDTWGFQSSISRNSMIQAIHSPQTNTISPWTKQMIPCNNEDFWGPLLGLEHTGTMGASGIRMEMFIKSFHRFKLGSEIEISSQSKLITQRNSFSGALPASVCNSTFILYKPLQNHALIINICLRLSMS